MSSKERRTFEPRWIVRGTLTTAAPLHLGDGGTTQEISDRQTVEASSIARDHNSKPYLPASSLKGALRGWLAARSKIPEDKEILFRLFGAESDVDAFGAGCVRLMDACLAAGQSSQVQTLAGVAIDRHSGTAKDNLLFHRQIVPANVSFDVAVVVEGNSELVALLLAVLEGFNDPTSPILLGSDTGNGFGAMKWNMTEVLCFDQEEKTKWLGDGGGQRWEEFATPRPSVKPAPLPAASKNIRMDIELRFDSLFLVNDPALAQKKGESKEPDATPRLDSSGKPFLPASSFRGAFRAQAERILRTLGVHTCDAAGDDACKPVKSLREVRNLCLACQLFGASGWASRIDVSDFKSAGKVETMVQEFVAIDRFTGGGADGAKFNARAAVSPVLSGHISWNELENWQLGLLILVLRDLAEGDIGFGLGRAKGYGACTAGFSVGNSSYGNLSDLISVLHKEVTAIAGSSAIQNETADSWGARALHALRGRAGARPVAVATEPDAASPEPPLAKPRSVVNNNAFHNPYHFIPAPAPKPDRNCLNRTGFESGELGHHSHAQYATHGLDNARCYSGRIVCRLTNETPFFIGDKSNEPTQPKTVLPFRIDDKLAIPATSLRGLLSSAAEAASGSTLRVLGNKTLSFRKAMKPNETLSALGRVVETPTPEGLREFRLQPLALPTLTADGDDFPLPPEYDKIFPETRLKIYVGNYRPTRDGPIVDSSGFVTSTSVSYNSINKQYHYMKLDLDNPVLHMTPATDFLLGQKPADNNFVPITADEFERRRLAGECMDGYVRGIVRILGRIGADRADVPKNKKHELFIPFTEAMENEDIKTFPIISDDVVSCFEELAKERNDDESRFPYFPRGTRTSNDSNSLSLKTGDIVYFAVDAQGQICEISFSSIWRGRVNENGRAAKVHNFFEKISPELLPMNPERSSISPAELMFGFVQTNEGTRPPEKSKEIRSLAFAGKLRPSVALLDNDKGLLPPVPLKILSSPKPPSPSLYFQRKQGAGYIAKAKLNPKDHLPRGRKQYLHALRAGDNVAMLTKTGGVTQTQPTGAADSSQPWESCTSRNRARDDRAAQRVIVTPVEQGGEFWFHIDFDNLSRWELALLCFSLRPFPEFRHKLGMGKPIGLGSVRIDPLGLFLVDRDARYRDNKPKDLRWHRTWTAPNSTAPERYSEMWTATTVAPSVAPDPAALAAEFAKKMDPNVKHALRLLGDPDQVIQPVHYPQVEKGLIEDENYKWFVANDKGSGSDKKGNKIRAAEKPMGSLDGDIPTLTRLPFND